jgi:hypothetical protein
MTAHRNLALKAPALFVVIYLAAEHRKAALPTLHYFQFCKISFDVRFI